MAELFGFTITRKKDEGGASFTLPTSDDGAEDIAQGGFYSSTYDIEGKDRTQYDLIRRYRNIDNNQSVIVRLKILLVKRLHLMNMMHPFP